ncbi:MAG: C1 family peptidase [bacterium]
MNNLIRAKGFPLFAITFIVCSIFICSMAYARLTPEQARELAGIQKTIHARGARWKAGETSVLRLPPEERRRLCGLFFTEGPKSSSWMEEGPTVYTAGVNDTSFDWRSEGVVTPIKNQGSCGSCWAFAAVGAMESYLLKIGDPRGNDLSEQLVVSCDTSNYGCCGGYMDRAYNYLTLNGTTDEACLIYNPSGYCSCFWNMCRSYTSRCTQKCGDWQDRAVTIPGWEWVPDPLNETLDENGVAIGVRNINTALQQHGPIPCGMFVYEDFYSYTGGVYRHLTGAYVGGHAVIIVGCGEEDGVGYWIIKNSWSTDWGEDGFCRIQFFDCSIGRDAAVFTGDMDGDGYSPEEGDCDDHNPAINPDAEEVCDGVDNNCNGNIDEGLTTTYYHDGDGDGYGNLDVTIEACSAPDGYVTNSTDCNDDNAAIYPGAQELCGNGIDEDCDGEDSSCEGCTDEDKDGYYVEGGICGPVDCNDDNSAINPDAVDICDGVDNNCNEVVDEGTPEVCDGVDNDCDGSIDEGVTTTYYEDVDGDGYGNPDETIKACSAPEGYVINDEDCDDNAEGIHPGAQEECGNGVDEDCSGEDLPCITCKERREPCSSNDECCSGRCRFERCR